MRAREELLDPCMPSVTGMATGLRQDPFPSECGSLPVGRGNCQRDGLICLRRLGNQAPPGRERSRLNLQRALKRFLKITVASGATALVLVYAGDYALFRYRSASNRIPYGSVAVRHYYAVQHKDGKTEFLSIRPLHRFVCTPCSRTAATLPAGIWSAIKNRGPKSDLA